MTSVVNKYHSRYDVYIGRGSKWGNPFLMRNESQRNEVIQKYEEYARARFTKADLQQLVGKRLGCFCKPKACHGDVLVKLIKEYGLEQETPK